MKKSLPTVIYSLTHICMWSINAALLGFSSNYLYQFGMSDGQISLILSVTTLISCLLQMLLGEMLTRARRVKLYQVLIGANLLLAACAAGMSVRALPVAALGAASVNFIVHQATGGLLNGLATDAIGQGAPVNFGVARAIGSLSAGVTAQVMGQLVGKMGANVICVSLMIAALGLSAAVLWFHLSVEKKLPERKAPAAVRDTGKKENFFRKYPRFTIVLISGIFLYHSGVSSTFFMMQIMASKGGTVAQQGLANSLAAYCELPVMLGFGFLMTKFNLRTMLRFAGIMITCKAALLMWAPTPTWVCIAQMTQMLGLGLRTVSIVEYGARAISIRDQVRAQSYLEVFNVIGVTLATATGGTLCQLFGVQVMLGVTVATAAIGAVLLFIGAEPVSRGRAVR